MREILFRGRRIDTGEWVYGHPVGWQNESGDISIVDSRFGACIDADGNLMMLEAPFVVKVDPATIGQFTGLTDKNGKKIFEGDTVRYKDALTNKMHCGVVNFADASFRITDGGFHGYRWQDYEVEVVKERHGEELDG